MRQLWHDPPSAPVLTPAEVHVWWSELDRPSAEVRALRAILSPDEQARAERFRFEEHRSRFIVGRGLLRTLLAGYLGTQPRQVSFTYGAQGKPALAKLHAGSWLQFNVSHSHTCALFAFSTGRAIGVDVEQIKPMPEADQIAERFFSLQERRVLRGLPPEAKTEAFFRCWARKEAVIKAVGAGLSIPLDSFDVTLAPGEPASLLRYAEDPGALTRWSLHDLPAIPGYAAALMTEGTGWELRCWAIHSRSGETGSVAPAAR